MRLGNIGDWGSGSTPAKGRPDYYGGNILWLRTGELNNGTVYDTEIKITEKALNECSFRLNKVGDVMIAMYGATIGKVAIAGKEMTTNQACCGCTPICILNKYLFYFLMGSQEDFIKKGEGGAQPNISREKIVAHLMPLPPFEEQNRIVEKIESVLPLIELYGKSQDKLNTLNKSIFPLLRKSVLQEAIQGKLVPQDPNDEPASILLERIKEEKAKLFKEGKLKKKDLVDSVIFKGEDNKYYEKIGSQVTCIDEEIPFEIPDRWAWARGKTIFMPMQSTRPTGESFTYIDVDAVNNRKNIIDNAKCVPTSIAPSRATRKLWHNSILFSMVRPYLKNIALVGKEYCNAIASTGFYVIRPSIHLYPEYIFQLMLSAYVVDGLNKFMKGDNSPSINNEHIEEFLYPIPPAKEQQRIICKLSELLPIMK